MKNRIHKHPILGSLEKNDLIHFTFNGNEYKGYEGDTIASALLANGIRTLRFHEESGTPRGIYCNIGHCYECRVTVNETPGIRACLTKIKPQMRIKSGNIQPLPFKPTSIKKDLPRTYEEFLKRNRNKGENKYV